MRRRTVLKTTGALLTGSLAGCVSAPERPVTAAVDVSPPAGTWPQVGYDARHTRYTGAHGPGSDAEIAWTALNRPVYPPVVDDALYLTEGWTDGAALSLGTDRGTERWTNDDLPPSRWAPAIGWGKLFVLSRTGENVVRLHALDTETAEQVWVREEWITAGSGPSPPVGPTVHESGLYLGTGRGVVALDPETGEPKWRTVLSPDWVETDGGPAWSPTWAKPAVTDERVLSFDRNQSYRTQRIHALDRATGEHDWTARLELGPRWHLGGHLIVGGGRAFVRAGWSEPVLQSAERSSLPTAKNRLFAVDADSGVRLWNWTAPDLLLREPAYADGTVYLGGVDRAAETGHLYALDSVDGEVEWTYRTDAGSVSGVTVAGDTVYVEQGEELAAVDRTNGSLQWRLDVGDHFGPPVVVDGTTYLQIDPGHNHDSRVLAVREP